MLPTPLPYPDHQGSTPLSTHLVTVGSRIRIAICYYIISFHRNSKVALTLECIVNCKMILVLSPILKMKWPVNVVKVTKQIRNTQLRQKTKILSNVFFTIKIALPIQKCEQKQEQKMCYHCAPTNIRTFRRPCLTLHLTYKQIK